MQSLLTNLNIQHPYLMTHGQDKLGRYAHEHTLRLHYWRSVNSTSQD